MSAIISSMSESNKQSNSNSTISYDYQKRIGTSGLSGQLYETKLLTLILLRALWNDNIKDFVLGTNLEGVDAFDDIVFRYETSNPNKTKIIFLQAKHKDDPNKDKLAVEDIFKQNGDFSLIKYFESFLKVRQQFVTDRRNAIFKDPMQDIECDFIIFTSAQEQFTKKKIIQHPDEESFLKTSKYGKAFQFTYDDQDIQRFMSTFTKSRVTLLAKCLSKCIFKDNLDSKMAHDLIKTYHVYLANNVIKIEYSDTITQDINSCKGKFHDSFWTSNDDILSHMRSVICKEFVEMKGITSPHHQQAYIETVLKSLTFKIPLNFGNRLFRFYGNAKKQQKRFEYLCSIFHKIFLKHLRADLFKKSNLDDNIIIEIDEDSVGPGKLIHTKDLESYRLAGLVGNLLINVGETEILKFNLDEQSLSDDNIQILHHLKERYDLSRYRFYIDVHGFPRMSFACTKRDQKLMIDFLSKLKFYTNQGKEVDVENIIKQEIVKYFYMRHKKCDVILTRDIHIKSDTIFLKVHDNVQNWWKKPAKSTYLTKSCEFYQQAETEVLNSSTLHIIHLISSNKYRNNLFEFENEAFDDLEIDSFLKNDQKVFIIISDEADFSSKKVIQYFEKIKMEKDYIFIDFNSINIENMFEVINVEIERLEVSLLVLIIHEDEVVNNHNIRCITDLFNGKVIIISNCKYDAIYTNTKIKKDLQNNFSGLSSNLRETILRERKVIVQGIEFTVNEVFNEKSLNMLSSHLLRNIIENKTPEIGATLTNKRYNETIHRYFNQSVCRYIILKDNLEHSWDIKGELLFMKKNLETNCISNDQNDIILKSESQNTFEETCEIYKESNIHWFTTQHSKHEHWIWRQTRGSVENLMPYIDRSIHEDFTLQLNTFKDIQEKVVIISAEPGMGKSTLLTRLTINTKRLYPSLWIVKINLSDYVEQLNEWKENKTNINLIDALAFLYSTVIENYNSSFLCKESVFKLVEVIHNSDVISNEIQETYSFSFDLSEIKLLNHFYNNANLAVVFDGFDEICPDYTDEVLQLLCILKSSKIAHLWITSRQYNVLDQLQSALNIFCYNLNSMTQLQQTQFLYNTWFQNSDTSREFNFLSKKTVDEFYVIMSSILQDVEGNFFSIPLHLSMFAEIYQNIFTKYDVESLSVSFKEELENTNIVTLYENMIETKFYKIRFGEKNPSINLKAPDIKNMVTAERNLFIEKHKKIAAYMLLDHDVVLSEHDIKSVDEFIVDVKIGNEKNGIIECVVGNNIKFAHITFAEYFAAEYVLDKILKNGNFPIYKYFVDHILTFGNNGVRRFLNSKLKKDQSLLIQIISHEEQMKTLFEILLAQDSNLPNAMNVAMAEDLDYIALLLLKSAQSVVTKNSLPRFIKCINSLYSIKRDYNTFCVLCTAISKDKIDVLSIILTIITNTDYTQLIDLFYCFDIPISHPILKGLSKKGMIKNMISEVLDKVPQLMLDIYHIIAYI